MGTVGYLLGAGASAQCIPVVNKMANDINDLMPEIQGAYTKYDDFSGNYVGIDDEKCNQVVKLLSRLHEVCNDHFSIDTYAKKLFLTDPRAFKQLKLVLSFYFTLRQILTPPDKRYDNFFSSILTTGLKLPSKVKIISWNYDFQIERSYLEFEKELELNTSRQALGLYAPHEWTNHGAHIDKFNVIKLNGSARITTDKHDGYLVGKITKDTSKLVQEAADKYLDIVNNGIDYDCELKFAWENDHYETLFDTVKSDLAKIDVLVVIGYSFPFFNREVDIELFKRLTGLKKIIVQDLNPEDIIETMEEFVDTTGRHKQSPTIVAKRNVIQFVFPKELDVIG